jgi:hypothetical protein
MLLPLSEIIHMVIKLSVLTSQRPLSFPMVQLAGLTRLIDLLPSCFHSPRLEITTTTGRVLPIVNLLSVVLSVRMRNRGDGPMLHVLYSCNEKRA